LSRRESENLQHQAEHTRPRRRAPIAGYLVVLFAVAFLLLLMAYFQQQRQSSEATTDALKQSASAVESIQALMEENKAMREEIEALEDQVSDLKQSSAALSAQVSGLTDDLDKTRRAMDFFWQLDEAYVRGRYGLSRDLIEALEDTSQGTPLKNWLPKESTTDTERFSPADRYQEIYDALY